MKAPKHLPKLNTKTSQKPNSDKPLTPERAKEIFKEIWNAKRLPHGKYGDL
tara:strand:+ start:129 stop:281 length:153 start_codon:yes stop_codon:yes gene_type:complete